ncbi:MAG: ArsR/SmtB family transcription factor [Flexilinea sp.]
MPEEKIIEQTKILKAIADPKRLKIVKMLSNGELCACKILEEFHITQPTLSHDMKVLCEAGIVTVRKDGKWMHYSLNIDRVENFIKFLNTVFFEKNDDSDGQSDSKMCCRQ